MKTWTQHLYSKVLIKVSHAGSWQCSLWGFQKWFCVSSVKHLSTAPGMADDAQTSDILWRMNDKRNLRGVGREALPVKWVELNRVWLNQSFFSSQIYFFIGKQIQNLTYNCLDQWTVEVRVARGEDQISESMDKRNSKEAFITRKSGDGCWCVQTHWVESYKLT